MLLLLGEKNSEERIKYAKQLLEKVRLPLLSEHALKYVLNKVSLLSKNNDCVNIIETALVNKNYFQYNSAVYYTTRYCNQTKFKLLICGGFDERLDKFVSEVKQFDGDDVNNLKNLTRMNSERYDFQAVCLKGEVYVFGGINNAKHYVKCVEKYSPTHNNWMVVTELFDNRHYFCACAFMDKVYVFGGYFYKKKRLTNSCLQFDTKQENWSHKSWKKITGMNAARWHAACADFLGRIRVSGGNDDAYNGL